MPLSKEEKFRVTPEGFEQRVLELSREMSLADAYEKAEVEQEELVGCRQFVSLNAYKINRTRQARNRSRERATLAKQAYLSQRNWRER